MRAFRIFACSTGVHRLAGADACLDAEHPGRLREVTRLVEDPEVDADRHILDATAVWRRERQLEEPFARRTREHRIDVAGRAVNFFDLARIRQNDRNARVDGQVSK